jgi:4-hydroxy-2-oxoheptanedioate aldolase
MTALREQWAAGQPTFGAWLSIPSTLSAEATARVGFDYVCVDNQHGAIDYDITTRMIQAIQLGGGRPIVRVPWNEPGIVGKMLDAGAEGIIVPMVNSAAEATAVVRAVRYPPVGARSFGPVFAGLRVADYAVDANKTVAAIPMIETAEALGRLDEILSVEGVDAVYVGPADLSLSLGLPPRNNDDSTAFTGALEAIVTACRRHGVVPGIHASGALAKRRREQGFLMITVASDAVAMRAGLAGELAQAHETAATRGADRPAY